jgi:hypothetical protein
MSPGMEVDFVVHSVYTKVKDLENKYIDLANYYKEAARGNGAKLTNKPTDRTQENEMIRGLLEQKRELDDDMASMQQLIAKNNQAARSTPSLNRESLDLVF